VNVDLTTERAHLEREIAGLEDEISAMGGRLEIERAAGLRPRGLVLGLALGALVVFMFIVVSVIWAMSTIGRMD
jgi:hypothetical protein